MKPYQVGRAEHPSDDDPRYETEVEALDAARRVAMGDSVYAVWHWSKGDVETLYLIYQDDTWRLA